MSDSKAKPLAHRPALVDGYYDWKYRIPGADCKSNEVARKAYTELTCSGNCEFKCHREHENMSCSRNVKYRDSVFYDGKRGKPNRFICDPDLIGKVGVLVFGPTRESPTHVLMVKSYGCNWGIPKGSIEEDDPKAGAKKELLEETSISDPELIPLAYWNDPNLLIEDVHVHKITIKAIDTFIFLCFADNAVLPRIEDLVSIDTEISHIKWVKRGDFKGLPMNGFTQDLCSQIKRGRVISKDQGINLKAMLGL